METPEFVFEGFKKYFDTTTVFPETRMCIATGKYFFDILGFEKWLIYYGYKPEEPGSIAQFVTKRFGKEATKFIEKIIQL